MACRSTSKSGTGNLHWLRTRSRRWGERLPCGAPMSGMQVVRILVRRLKVPGLVGIFPGRWGMGFHALFGNVCISIHAGVRGGLSLWASFDSWTCIFGTVVGVRSGISRVYAHLMYGLMRTRGTTECRIRHLSNMEQGNSTPVFSLSDPLYVSFGMGGMRALVRFKMS
jgi:hypothetical protein